MPVIHNVTIGYALKNVTVKCTQQTLQQLEKNMRKGELEPTHRL